MKLSDAEFFEALLKNGGLYQRTATWIESEYGISYSRSSVKERADKHPSVVQQATAINLDKAEDIFLGLMMTKLPPKDSPDYYKVLELRRKVATDYLRMKGGSRGYIHGTNTLNIQNNTFIQPRSEAEVDARILDITKKLNGKVD